MPTTRLTFLYPHLYKSIRLSDSAATHTAAKARCRTSSPGPHHRPHAAAAVAAPFSTSARAREAVFERHGKAVEPQPNLPNVVKLPQPASQPPPQEAQKDASTAAAAAAEKIGSELKGETAAREEDKEAATAERGGDASSPPAGPTGAAASRPRQTAQQKSAEATMESSGPMDAVLHMPPPGHSAHRHIPKPQYVHHFDTYTLVKQLEASGYSKAQAITIMKAVRGLLARNLDVAQDGLVSKSDVENETYLFQAACSELGAEVSNNRKAADEVARQQRTLLQHEVDILSQKLTQDLMTLRDDVKAMFNDREMAVREEQRRMEGAIQQVNLDISVILTSDAKSDIEGLRWVLIRRSVLGILFMAVLTLGTIRYATYVNHERKRLEEEEARKAEKMKKNGGREDNTLGHEAAEILAAN